MSDRRWFIAAASGALLFAGYGSLVPFVVDDQVGWPDALARVRAMSLDLPGAARSGDLIVNLLLLVPVGFFGAAAMTGARPARGRLAVVGLLCLCVAGSLEWAQLFMRYRTASLSDVAALSVGGVAGTALWAVAGPRVPAWREAGSSLTPAQRLRALLWIYMAGWVVIGLLPLLFPERAYPLPRSIWRRPPPSEHFSTTLAGGVLAALAVAPLGVAAAWVTPGSPLRRVAALSAATVLVAWLDSLRQIAPGASIPDLGWRAAGLVLAFAAALMPWARGVAAHGLPSGRWAGYALAAWLAYFVFAAWAPFDFGVDAAGLSARLDLIYQRVPMHRYYWAPPLSALRMLGTLLLFGAVTGALARQASHSGRGLALLLVAATAVFAGVEWGQFHLPGHRPDPTDVLLLSAGMLTGTHLAAVMSATRK